MTFALHTPPLAPTDPSYQMIVNFQAQFDALPAKDNAAAQTNLTNWGWLQTGNPAAYWRLFERALMVAKTQPLPP